MARSFSPRQELWTIGKWKKHGVRRGEFIGYCQSKYRSRRLLVRLQLDDGSFWNSLPGNVFTKRAFAVRKIVKLYEDQIATIEGLIISDPPVAAYYQAQIATWHDRILKVKAS